MEEKERKGTKNVLLAGATGSLGSYIARELRKRGYSTAPSFEIRKTQTAKRPSQRDD